MHSMKRELTCIICPNGCELELGYEEQEGKKVLCEISGNLCKKGIAYAEQELTAPMRTISSSVLLENGELPLVSVRLTKPVRRELIFEVMREIRKQRLSAPVEAGQLVISQILGQDSDVIVTKSVKRKEG